MHIQSCERFAEHISVTFSDNKTSEFGLFWLRDHSTDARVLMSVPCSAMSKHLPYPIFHKLNVLPT